MADSEGRYSFESLQRICAEDNKVGSSIVQVELGMRVEIHGLREAAHLNGRFGNVQSLPKAHSSCSRLLVLLDANPAETDPPPDAEISVKVKNVRLVSRFSSKRNVVDVRQSKPSPAGSVKSASSSSAAALQEPGAFNSSLNLESLKDNQGMQAEPALGSSSALPSRQQPGVRNKSLVSSVFVLIFEIFFYFNLKYPGVSASSLSSLRGRVAGNEAEPEVFKSPLRLVADAAAADKKVTKTKVT